MTKKNTRFLKGLLLVLVTFNALLVHGAKQNSHVEAQQQAIAFVNVNVVPFDRERILAGQTVIVRDGRIAEIGPADKIKVPAGALQIDGRGKYLMPGLADMHVHLFPGAGRRMIWQASSCNCFWQTA